MSALARLSCGEGWILVNGEEEVAQRDKQTQN